MHFLLLKENTELVYGLHYSKDESECVGFSDADWGGNLDTCRSTSGYVFCFGGTAITWRSKRQVCAALLTAEAEYMYVALAGTVQQSLWLQQLLDSKYHFTREQVSSGKIMLKYRKKSEMTVNFLTCPKV